MKQNILQLIERNINNLTQAQSEVADFILKNPVHSAFLTLDQLAGNVKTSTTTVMRFTYNLGYSGYAEFQKDLQELLRNRVAPYTRLETNMKNLGLNNLLVKCADIQIDNITDTLNCLSESSINNCLDILQSARKIYIIGVRTSYAIAYYLYHCLNQSLGNCELLEPIFQDYAEKMQNIESSDLLIAISFPRYVKHVIEIAKIVKDSKPKVIAITDSYKSPLAALSDVVLPCSFRSLAFHNSISGPIFLVDFLITALAMREPEKTKLRLEDAELLLKKLNLHYEK